jgi:DNA-binding PadR family transcriptional regulator
MDIKYALLGFLSWKPFTGYELKKIMTDSIIFYWSGNNNQIYTTLVQMHKDGLVTNEVQQQERYPARKIYSITGAGLDDLNHWITASPEMPQLRKPFLLQLAWSNHLSDEELMNILAKYEYEIQMLHLMLKEKERRKINLNPSRTQREKYIWNMIWENYAGSYETELEWVKKLRTGLKETL